MPEIELTPEGNLISAFENEIIPKIIQAKNVLKHYEIDYGLDDYISAAKNISEKEILGDYISTAVIKTISAGDGLKALLTECILTDDFDANVFRAKINEKYSTTEKTSGSWSLARVLSIAGDSDRAFQLAFLIVRLIKGEVPKESIDPLIRKWNIYGHETLSLFADVLFTEQPEIKEKTWCLSSEILYTLYRHHHKLPKYFIDLLKDLDLVLTEKQDDIKARETNLRYQYILIQLFVKQFNLKEPDHIDIEKLARLFSTISTPTEDPDSNAVPLNELIKCLTDSNEETLVITPEGHRAIAKQLISFSFGPKRFEADENEQSRIDLLVREYMTNIESIHNFISKSSPVNIIDLIIQLSSSKSLSIFILETLVSRLGLDQPTDDNSNTFNEKIKDISQTISNKILDEGDHTATLWKEHLVKILKAFKEKPGGLPETAEAFIDSIKDDEVISSIEFINKLSGFYRSMQVHKDSELDEFSTWMDLCHQISVIIIEIDKEVRHHNKVITNQLKGLTLGIGGCILIIALTILYVYQSWLIFKLMLASTIMTGLLGVLWFNWVESAGLNRNNNLLRSLRKKQEHFKTIKKMIQSERFSSLCREYNQFTLEIISAAKEKLSFFTARLPALISSALVGLAYGIALSIPIWAYYLNVYQPLCWVPAIAIFVFATLCYNWANQPVAYETSNLLETNHKLEKNVESSLFKQNDPSLNTALQNEAVTDPLHLIDVLNR